MNYYIIFTQEIHEVGGMQLYTAGKADFLQKKGWKPIVFHPGHIPLNNCAYSSLNRFVKYSMPFLEIPPTAYGSAELIRLINRMAKWINTSGKDIIYIESHYETAAMWAELLAKELGAKHICFNCNEVFRGGYKLYEYMQDFFWHKYSRNELLGLRPDTVCKIFEGYKDIEPDESTFFDAVEPEPIQDVFDERINRIQKADYTILYVGRIVKGYVPNIIDGVVEFAKKNDTKQIQFVIVGDISERKELLSNAIKDVDNISLVALGNMVPIPRVLYDHVDVVIAGAVCAEASARCDVPTIVADCENFWANGVLGYTVQNSMYAESQTSQTDFCTALEQVLLDGSYKAYEYIFPPAPDTDAIYQSHFEFFNNSSNVLDFYIIKKINIPVNYGKIKLLEYYRYYRFRCLYRKDDKKKDDIE